MWIFLSLFILINAVADGATVILEYRLDVAGLPINILDGLTLVCFIWSFLPRRNAFQADRPHPLLPWIMGAFLAAIAAGAWGATTEDLALRWILIPMRNMLVVPALVWVGYRALATPRGCARASTFYMFASMMSAVMVMLFVRDVTEAVASTSEMTFDQLRGTSVGGDFGLAAAGLILFCIVERVRLLPRWAGLIAVGACATAFFLIPHRSNWVMAGVTVMFAIFLLPRTNPGPKLVFGITSVAALFVFVLVAVQAVSSVTGKDFGEYTTKRLETLLPGQQEDVTSKAWDTRVPGAVREFELWSASPIFGRGFGYQSLDGLTHPEVSYNHTPWMAVPCQTGVFGLLAYVLVIIGPIVIGWRMVRDAVDRGSVLLGATAAIVATAAFMIGFMSLSWNGQRQGSVIAVMCGMVLRCRAMQLTARRLRNEQAIGLYQPELELAGGLGSSPAPIGL